MSQWRHCGGTRTCDRMLRYRLLLPLICMVSVMCFIIFVHFTSQLPRKDPTTSEQLLTTDLSVDQVSHRAADWSRPHSSAEDPSSADVRQTQVVRRTQMQSVCEQNGLGDPVTKMKDIDPEDFSRIYVDDQYKLLYCEVPKVACTNWKRILLILTGNMNTSEPERLLPNLVHTTYQHKYLRTLDTYKPKQILSKIKHYYKFMFVREPLERIVSAYVNKFTKSYNRVYQERYGRKIVQRYRANPKASSLQRGDDVTFLEYVHYLLDPKTKQPFDVHWRPFYQLCHPCLMKYDFIGKYKTLDTDVDFLLEELQIKDLIDFPERPSRAGPRTADTLDARFANISSEQIHRLWKLYSVDYAMFGYPYPDFSDE